MAWKIGKRLAGNLTQKPRVESNSFRRLFPTARDCGAIRSNGKIRMNWKNRSAKAPPKRHLFGWYAAKKSVYNF